MSPAPSIDIPLVAQAAAPGGSFQFPILMLLLFGVAYFLMIMPAQRQRKKLAQMISALKNGDKIITNGGIYGTVVGLDNESIQLRIAEQVKIRVARSAIAGLQPEAKES
ncbi:MAG TPA: preprotein translocase subunit YajC [Candidatus Acidoferrales bacterium]|nr:preprotein translocase subunit YajC [Candidatus Acidoferrales bacterium]